MQKITTCILGCLALMLALNLPCSSQQSAPQHISSFDRDRAINMLQMIASDVKKHYYDPRFHGLDWDATVQEAKQKIETSPSLILQTAVSRAAEMLGFKVTPEDAGKFFPYQWPKN